MKRLRLISIVAVMALVLVLLISQTQGASAQTKFLGNIWRTGTEPLNFTRYWDQVTPENSGKWASIEPTRDVMNTWNWLDSAYAYAKNRGIPFKEHTLVWGHSSGEPSWMCSLPTAEQQAEVVEWIQSVCQRYPDLDYIDVVNEPLHDPPCYTSALGGAGSTGWDWVVWSFQTARQYCGDAKLLINEYNILNNDEPAALENYINIINVLRSRGLVDGIGAQGHSMENTPASAVLTKLNRLDDLGLPIYVSELDLRGSDSVQLQLYQNLFPVMWEHNAVQGVTLWGYVQGQMWRDEAHLVRSDGSERPAMTWLMNYVNGNVTPTTPPPTTPPPTTPPPTTPPPTTPPPTTPPPSGNTGWVSPSAQAAQSGGDGNGFQTSPTNAFADDSAYATDTDSGNGTSTSCTSTSKDRHAYYSYPISIPAGSTINGIEVRLDSRADSTSGSPRHCVQLSWNNGTSWTSTKQTGTLTTSMASRTLGSASDNWGRAWTTGELTSATLRVRITNVASSTSRDFFLDWVAVRVTYGGTTPPPTTPPPTTPPPTTPPPTTPPPTTPPPTTPPPEGCMVSYVNQNDWGSGATINVTVRNNGASAVSGWTVTWTFPGNQQISNLWNGIYTQSGASVSVRNLDYNAVIGANGGTVSFGFNISYSGSNTAPTGFRLNGMLCQ